MVQPGHERDGGKLTTPDSPPEQARQQSQPGRKGQPDREEQRSRTAGTNRDFDESGESRNQGHGHPRAERGANA